MPVQDILDQSGLKKTRGERLVDLAYNAGYILRLGLGIKGSPFKYHLSQAGREVVNSVAGATLFADG